MTGYLTWLARIYKFGARSTPRAVETNKGLIELHGRLLVRLICGTTYQTGGEELRLAPAVLTISYCDDLGYVPIFNYRAVRTESPRLSINQSFSLYEVIQSLRIKTCLQLGHVLVRAGTGCLPPTVWMTIRGPVWPGSTPTAAFDATEFTHLTALSKTSTDHLSEFNLLPSLKSISLTPHSRSKLSNSRIRTSFVLFNTFILSII